MKKQILKISVLSIFLLSGCQVNLTGVQKVEDIVIGKWENTVKNPDGSGVLTELEIKEVKQAKTEKYNKTFNGTMNSNLIGKESETLKILTKNINISGIADIDSLQITDIESESDTINANSRFIISNDGKFLTLTPGEIKFHRK